MQKFPGWFRSRYAVLLVAVIVALTFGANTEAQTVDVIHTFSIPAGQGSLPYSGLIEDGAGNFYGTTLRRRHA